MRLWIGRYGKGIAYVTVGALMVFGGLGRLVGRF